MAEDILTSHLREMMEYYRGKAIAVVNIQCKYKPEYRRYEFAAKLMGAVPIENPQPKPGFKFVKGDVL